MTKEKKEKALIIFAKEPMLGLVKTRLAKSIGEIEALAAYNELLQINTALASSKAYDVFIYATPKCDLLKKIYPASTTFNLQKGEDLGQRLYNAFSEALKEYKKVLAIGVDSPFISSEVIDKSFSSLESSNLVIGPSTDGGYYLIGMIDCYQTLFEGIDWGSEKVLGQTLEKCGKLNLKPSLLTTLYDIDTIEDYILWKKEVNDVK